MMGDLTAKEAENNVSMLFAPNTSSNKITIKNQGSPRGFGEK